MLSVDAEIAWANENTSAYRRWCAGLGHEPLVLPASPDRLENSAYEMTCALLDGSDPPDAIFASAERFSTGVLRAARERGLRIPADLMVATGIDSWEAREASPPVTAVDVQPASGCRRGRAPDREILGESPDAPVITPSRLHVRASTG